ncbi:MAG: peptidyl-prolyl cis-trans isomerase [Acidimicrobiales bacterium]|nr:MAG: peptidyl-prolyl cis-trans isomerase [Acidimicrobiales bacterium]
MTEADFVTLNTNHGAIRIQLFTDHAPKTVDNFLRLARDKSFYDGTIFHRIISGFMIQGGDPKGTGTGGPGYTFADEFHPDLAFNKPYLLAMANSGPNTNGSQFFLTVSATNWLTNKHTIFGEVADEPSRSVVNKIGALPTGAQDRPVNDVTIESVAVERVVV